MWFVVFVAVRSRAAWKYAPRTRSKTLRKDNYSPELPNTLFGWLPKLWAIPDSYVLTHQGLDAYLFLRFLKMAVISCLVGAAICIPVLMAVDATGGGGQSQLNIISMSNIAKTPLGSWRFFAHAGCAWLFFGGYPAPTTSLSTHIDGDRFLELLGSGVARSLSPLM